MAVRAIRSIDNEKLNIDNLKAQVAECPPVEPRFEKAGLAFLISKNVYDVRQIDPALVEAYGQYLQDLGGKKEVLISAYKRTLVKWRGYLIRQDFKDLIEEAKPCTAKVPSYKNRAVDFLIEEGIHSLAEIDCTVRDNYKRFLEVNHEEHVANDYLKALDQLKLFSIKNIRNGPKPLKVQLQYEEKKIFLGYHPNYEVAMFFYWVPKKYYLTWDFSIDVSKKLKHQMIDMLNLSFEHVKNTDELRKAYVQPLWYLYSYCIEKGIEDATVWEQEQIDDYAAWIAARGKRDIRHRQIIERVQKFLFLYSEEVNWEANVWYLERFEFSAAKYNPSIPVHTITFSDIKNKSNRAILKDYVKYQFGATRYVIHHIRAGAYFVKHLLRYLEDNDIELMNMDAGQIEQYMQVLGEENKRAATFNDKVFAVYHFFEFLKGRKFIEKNPLLPEYFIKKEIYQHHDRTVPDKTVEKILTNLHLFPEEIRLMYLHLWSLGLRINEVCTLKGQGYYLRDGLAWLNVYQYKMVKEKVIPIPMMLYKAVRVYMERKEIGLDEFLFQNKKGGAFSTYAFWHWMNDICTEFGIDCRDYVFRSHDYRHSMATMLYDEKVSVQAIRDFLGHRDEDMTKQYIDYMPKKVMKANKGYFTENKSLALTVKGEKKNEG